MTGKKRFENNSLFLKIDLKTWRKIEGRELVVSNLPFGIGQN